MVVHDFNVKCIAALKPKTHTPLVVDANAPLPDAVAAQCFEPVGRGLAHVLYHRGRIQLGQTHDSATQDVRRQATRLACGKQAFGFGAGKVFNHMVIINNLFIVTNAQQ